MNDEDYKEVYEGKEIKMKFAKLDNTDWAYAEISDRSTLIAYPDMSKKLKALTPIITAGYSYGAGSGNNGTVSPVFGKASVGKNGLEGGMILLTNRPFGQGNSGGAAFIVNKNGNYVVVGIVSATMGS